MKINNYLNDKKLIIYTDIFIILILIGILYFFNISSRLIFLIATIYIAIKILYFLYDYNNQKNKFLNYGKILDNLDKKYLFGEMIEINTYYDEIIKDIIKQGNKSMMDEINIYKNNEREYKEFIELFVHDIKTPISTINLICENNKNNETKKIRTQNQKISNLVDNILYLSKSTIMENDYHISKYNLKDIINTSLQNNKILLIENNTRIEIVNCDIEIFSDYKWLVFILNQLISNSVKYKKEDLKIIFNCVENSNFTMLSIIDNGIGFNPYEKDDIFLKGYTGKNSNINSTGMGLYIVKKLIDRLNLAISLDTEYTNGGKVNIIFPKKDYYNII